MKNSNIILFFLCFYLDSFCQPINDSLKHKIDLLFTKWDTPFSPGCAIAVVRNDSIIYSKGYGMANLEYSIPNEPKTIFHVASVSKQFTAWAIIRLAEEGKISLDDDIRKYLIWFPDLKEKISIRNLLNHTSGIRDQWQLLALAGTESEDLVTQQHIIKILSKQQGLNFKPGDKYMYSNSGYSLLAEIVKAVTGQTLRQFSDSTIFKPLGMYDSHIHDECTEIVKGRSYSYDRIGSSHFTNSILSYSNSGATGLFTNVIDMSKWVMNFYTPQIGSQKDIDTLTKNAILNNGREIPYAAGLVTELFKGWQQYSHSGGDAGYRSYISVIPDIKMGFIIFSNLADFNPEEKANEIKNILVRDKSLQTNTRTTIRRDSVAAQIRDISKIKIYAGYYIGEDGLPISFEIVRGKFYYHIYEQSNFLIEESKDVFSIPQTPDVSFAFSIDGKDTILNVKSKLQEYRLIKYNANTVQTNNYLNKYTGTYYCPELDCTYNIEIKDHSLMLTNAKYSDTKITLIGSEHLMTNNWWISHLMVIRDKNNNVTGFEINCHRIMHLRFNKLR